MLIRLNKTTRKEGQDWRGGLVAKTDCCFSLRTGVQIPSQVPFTCELGNVGRRDKCIVGGQLAASLAEKPELHIQGETPPQKDKAARTSL